MTFLTHIPFHLTAISPIHIGNGEEIDWTTSIADENYLYILNLMNMNLSPVVLQKIKDISLKCQDEKGLLELQQIFKAEKGQLIKNAVTKITLPTNLAREFASKLGHNVQKKQRGNVTLNQLNIDRTAHGGPSQKAMIPGSSLKGAVRTAWLASSAEGCHKEGKELNEEEVLGGSFATDPFRLFKVDDSLSSQGKATQVYYLINQNRKTGKEKANMRLEAITPYIYGNIVGGFRFHDLEGKKVKNKEDQPPAIVKLPAIMKLIAEVNDYNIGLFREQFHQLEELAAVDKKWLKNTQTLIDRMDRKNCMLIRLGRLTTAESKTVGEELREIHIPQAKDYRFKYRKHGTTFWLAGDYKSRKNLLPMGWAVIEIGEYKSIHLQNYCKLMSQSGPATARQAAPLPDTPQQAIAWAKKTLGAATGSKEVFGPQILTLLDRAKKWPENDMYDFLDIVDKYDFGKSQSKINDILDMM